MQTYDRPTFFDYVRDELFDGALTQQQVDGMGIILALWEGQYTGTPMTDQRWLAYILATVFHECATTMWPITEYGSQEYLQGKDYWPYIGRGFVMITWKDNYEHASRQLSLIGNRDLVDHPEMALDSLIASRILFRGMAEGWFTGKKLGQYFNDEDDDPINARQIVNGNDDDTLIAGYHGEFLSALEAATVDELTPSEEVTQQRVTLGIKRTPGVLVDIVWEDME